MTENEDCTNVASTAIFFQQLDAGFVNFQNQDNKPYLYKTSDLYVQNSFELPIPTIAGSVIKYTFTTTIGDIGFAITFFSPNQAPDVVIEPCRVPSDVEPITGQFRSPKDGTFIMKFDNSFSWFTPKMLSYVVELYQPAFTVADNSRCLRARSLLATTLDDTHRAEMRLVKAQEKWKALRADMPGMEERLAALELELHNKKLVLATAEEECKDMTERIQYNQDKKNGLCIRSLNKFPLTLMLSYLGVGVDSRCVLVCKYWRHCMRDYHTQMTRQLLLQQQQQQQSCEGEGAGAASQSQQHGLLPVMTLPRHSGTK